MVTVRRRCMALAPLFSCRAASSPFCCAAFLDIAIVIVVVVIITATGIATFFRHWSNAGLVAAVRDGTVLCSLHLATATGTADRVAIGPIRAEDCRRRTQRRASRVCGRTLRAPLRAHATARECGAAVGKLLR